MAIAGLATYTGYMAKYTPAELDRAINDAAERAAGTVYEKFKYDIDLVLESTGFIRQRLEDMPNRDDFNELAAEVRLVKRAVIDTNRDLPGINKPGWFPGKKH